MTVKGGFRETVVAAGCHVGIAAASTALEKKDKSIVDL